MELVKTDQGVTSLKDHKPDFKAMEDFTRLINQAPPKDGVQKTPDGKAETLVISYVESKLDEIYLRQWGAEDINIQQVGNEILVWLSLWVIDPQTRNKIVRPGFAAVVITVDKAPDGVFGKEKNAWALDMSNKKPNALYLAFPKAKSMAIKNAAQTLGVIFGRNLNRKFEDTPEAFYGQEFEARETIEELTEKMEQCKSKEELGAIFNSYPALKTNNTFVKAFAYHNAKFKKVAAEPSNA